MTARDVGRPLLWVLSFVEEDAADDFTGAVLLRLVVVAESNGVDATGVDATSIEEDDESSSGGETLAKSQ